MNIRVMAVLVAFGLGGYVWLSPARTPPPGIVAAETPEQAAPEADAGPWPVADDYRATALASYRIHARVLGVKHYGYDRCAPVAPVDLALGWGPMSDSSVYTRLDISQRGRFYVYEWGSAGPPIPPREIITHSANNHIIPADAQVARSLDAVRRNDVVWLEGALVEVTGPGGFKWRSSLTRDDTGNGSCELFRVTNLVIELPASR